MSHRVEHVLSSDERAAFVAAAVLSRSECRFALPPVQWVRLTEWVETLGGPTVMDGSRRPISADIPCSLFRVDVFLAEEKEWWEGPRAVTEDAAFAATALHLALAQGLRPEHILLAAAVHEEHTRTLTEKAAEHHDDVVLHALAIASGAVAVNVESVSLPAPTKRPPVRGPFAFLAGAARSPSQARMDLFEVERYCAEHGHFGPGGMAHVAGVKLSEGASEEELWVLIRSCILTARMFRPTTRFDFVSYLGAAHGAYCLVAWLLWGVVRWRRAQVTRVTRTIICEAV